MVIRWDKSTQHTGCDGGVKPQCSSATILPPSSTECSHTFSRLGIHGDDRRLPQLYDFLAVIQIDTWNRFTRPGLSTGVRTLSVSPVIKQCSCPLKNTADSASPQSPDIRMFPASSPEAPCRRGIWLVGYKWPWPKGSIHPEQAAWAGQSVGSSQKKGRNSTPESVLVSRPQRNLMPG